MSSLRRGAHARRPFAADGPIGYDATVLLDSPLWYALTDEVGSTTVAADASGHGHNGSYIGTYALGQPSIMPTDPSTSVRVGNGGGGALNVLGDPWLVDGMTGEWTLEGWFKFNSLGGNEGVISRFENGSAGQDGLLWLDLSANLQANWHTAGGYARTTPIAVTTGVSYHMVMEYDGEAVNLYLNGELVGSAAGSGASASSGSTHLNFGSYGNVAYHVDGWLQKCALYDHALGADRVEAHYAAG